MNIGYDVVVVGAGPVGISTACLIKALNNESRICVIDKRAEPTRNHGIHINHDSVAKIKETFDKALKSQDPHIDEAHIKDLNAIFAGWSESFIRTNEIELQLAKKAHEMGIQVLRGPEYGVTEENFDSLFEADRKSASELQQIFEGAHVIIGADGSHSVVRKVVMKDRFSVDETLRHVIEFKYHTKGDARPRGFTEAYKTEIIHGHLNFETMSSRNVEDTKPATFHIFTDEATFDSLRVEDKKGDLKGVFGNSWTLNDLKELAVTDAKVKRVVDELEFYNQQVVQRGGSCLNEKISTLSLRIYRSENCLQKYKNKYVMLVGDSESGLILERGFNKGLKCGALCAEALSTFFAREERPEEMPAEFQAYKNEINNLFDSERVFAKVKNHALKAVEGSIQLSHRKYEKTVKIPDEQFFIWYFLGRLFKSRK